MLKLSDIMGCHSFKTKFGGRMSWLMKEELVIQSVTCLTNSTGLFFPSLPNNHKTTLDSEFFLSNKTVQSHKSVIC